MYHQAMKRVDLYQLIGIFVGIVIYGGLQWPQFFSLAVVPDEFLFMRDAALVVEAVQQQGWWQVIWHQANTYGYGSLYWLYYAAIRIYTTDSLFWMRLLAWVSYVAVPILLAGLAWRFKKSDAWLVPLLWLVLPAAWWYGKLSGPEPVLLLCALLGVAVIFFPWKRSAWQWLGWCMLGLGIGFKMTVLPVVVFVAIIMAFRLKRKVLRYGSMAAACAFIGFVIANPAFIVEPGLILNNYTSSPDYSLSHLKLILTNNTWTWDGIFIGGWFEMGFSAFAWLAYLIWLWRAGLPKTIWIAAASSFTLALGLMLRITSFYGWYWFPTLLLIPVLYLFTTQPLKRQWGLAGLTIGVAILTNGSLIAQAYHYRSADADFITQRADIMSCIEQAQPANITLDLVINYFDLQFVPPGSLNIAPENVIAPFNSLLWLQEPYYRPATLVVVRHRLIEAHPELLPLPEHITTTANNRYNDVEFSIQHLATCADVDVYLVTGELLNTPNQ